MATGMKAYLQPAQPPMENPGCYVTSVLRTYSTMQPVNLSTHPTHRGNSDAIVFLHCTMRVSDQSNNGVPTAKAVWRDLGSWPQVVRESCYDRTTRPEWSPARTLRS